MVVISHCIDLGDVGLPYLPFTEALSHLRAVTDTVEMAIATRPALAGCWTAGSPSSTGGTDNQAARMQLFDGIAAVLGASGTPQAPLVLMIEDLHWADPSSRDVLRFLLARLRTENLLVVGTYRTDDLHRRHPLRPLLAELLRLPKVDHLELAPFTKDELADFSAAITGQVLTDAVLQRVLSQIRGQCLLRAGIDGGRPGRGGTAGIAVRCAAFQAGTVGPRGAGVGQDCLRLRATGIGGAAVVGSRAGSRIR